MGRVIADFIVFSALFIVVLGFTAVLFGAGRFKKLTKKYDSAARERAVAKQNPYTAYDISFMVESGMTPDQIEKAIRNAVKNGDL